MSTSTLIMISTILGISILSGFLILIIYRIIKGTISTKGMLTHSTKNTPSSTRKQGIAVSSLSALILALLSGSGSDDSNGVLELIVILFGLSSGTYLFRKYNVSKK